MTKEKQSDALDAFDRVYKNKRAKGLTMHFAPCESYNCCNEAGFDDDMIAIRTALTEHAASQDYFKQTMQRNNELEAENARLREHIRLHAKYCGGIAALIKGRGYELVDAQDQIFTWKKQQFRHEQALKGQDNDTE